jgi:DNA-binding MurR/RpiR family transcriptional regulator
MVKYLDLVCAEDFLLGFSFSGFLKLLIDIVSRARKKKDRKLGRFNQ